MTAIESNSLLRRQAILIAEDEPLIALDLAFAVEDVDGIVVGPAASVEEALALLELTPVDGAILDVNLTDRDITPVVVFLAERGVPLILQSGIGLPPELRAGFPHLTAHKKPCIPKHLVDELAKMLVSAETDPANGAREDPRM